MAASQICSPVPESIEGIQAGVAPTRGKLALCPMVAGAIYHVSFV